MIESRHTSKFTRIGYYLVLCAIIVQFYLYFAHFQDTTEYGQYFSYITLIEGIFALTGLLLLDPINRRGFHLKPKNYEKTSGSLLIRIVIILVGLALIQFTIQMLPLVVKDWEIAMAIIFAAPSEEVFFRGVLVSLVIVAFRNVKNKFTIFKKRISIYEIFGIILTGIAFAMLHVNYYENIAFLLGTFLCGIWLGFTYFYWEDLTACILAHFILNFICVIQSFFLVTF